MQRTSLRLLLVALLASGPSPSAQEGAQPAKPAAFVQPLPGTTVSMRFVPIPGGTLARPPEEGGPLVVAPFFLAELETTWDAYDVLVYRFDLPEDAPEVDGVSRPTRPYIAADRGFGHAGFPAVSISSKGAVEFCHWLSLRTGRRYRLPSEAEWEWACRAGTTTTWWFGDDPEKLEDVAWIRGNSGLKTHRAGERPASPWGLRDMLGNVGEWCTAAEGGFAIRGGCYSQRPKEVTPTARRLPTPAWNANDPQIPKSEWWLTDGPFCGFRVLCEMDPTTGEPARAAEPPAEADPGGEKSG